MALPAARRAYVALTLRGIALGGADWTGMTLPAADEVALELCSLLHAENALEFADLADGTQVTVDALRDRGPRARRRGRADQSPTASSTRAPGAR